MEIRIKRTLPWHLSPKWWNRWKIATDHYHFHDGTVTRNYWLGHLWVQFIYPDRIEQMAKEWGYAQPSDVPSEDKEDTA